MMFGFQSSFQGTCKLEENGTRCSVAIKTPYHRERMDSKSHLENREVLEILQAAECFLVKLGMVWTLG
jgi:hypothetical protein